MDGAGFLPGQAQVVEQSQHAVLAVDDAEARRDDPAEILGPPAAHAVALGIRAPQHQRLERRQLAVIEPGRAAALGPIPQPLDALGVEADHPVPERLAVHARLAGGPPAGHPVQCVGYAEQPTGDPTIGLLARQAAQLRGRDVLSNRQPCTHGVTPLHHHAAE